MKKNIVKLLISIVLLNLSITISSADALIGKISKEQEKEERHPQVVDSMTNAPISNALVTIPKENKKEYTDKNGYFNIKPSQNKPIILSVQKEGYKPFSMTIKDGHIADTMKLKIEKTSPWNNNISSELLHLGDNSFSENSSGACLINAPCIGPEFSKEFSITKLTPKTKAYIEIGSIIGIDTIQAMKLGQNNLTNAVSSPLEVFVNNHKIGELKINGDNQKIPIPTRILKESSKNTLKLKTGINKGQTDFIDYDDIELMNIAVIIKN